MATIDDLLALPPDLRARAELIDREIVYLPEPTAAEQYAKDALFKVLNDAFGEPKPEPDEG
jgi:hypothetical protein